MRSRHGTGNLAAVATTLALAIATSACATLDREPRAAASSAGCVRAAVGTVGDPVSPGDKRLHCLAAARVAQRCSALEATLATYLKEVGDVFGRGNAELADIRAGRAGVRCARAAVHRIDLPGCCAASGY